MVPVDAPTTTLATSGALPGGPPPRSGAAPRCSVPGPADTRSTFVHRQLTETAPPPVRDALVTALGALDPVAVGPSLISVEGALGLSVPGDVHRPGLHMRGSEFCHVHPDGDGSLHVAADAEAAAGVLGAGWGEPHPLVPDTVLLYAPRTPQEVGVVADLVGWFHARAVRAREGSR